MVKHLFAIAVIFCGAALAWFILGGTLEQRTEDSDTHQRDRLTAQWGAPQVQSAPQITAYTTDGRKTSAVHLPILSSDVKVKLDLEQRRLGLLWYNLYDVDFRAHYVVRNDTPSSSLYVTFVMPSSSATYADLSYRVGGRSIDPAIALNANSIQVHVAPGQSTTVDLAYRSRGTESWNYRFAPKDGVQTVRNFSLAMLTNFDAIDFPQNTLLPEREERTGKGWTLRWNYSSLVTGNGIGMIAPYPMQPGPLAERVTFWAPVALLFYIFVMLMITTLRRIDLHPMNYFFLACAFFAFHLLFAYLVDRIPLEWAFVICSIVSMFLTISYLRLVAGLRFAALESGIAQLIYLVLFTYALFNEGWSGLTITIGAILTLFAAMQLTARIRWETRFAR